MNLQRHMRCHVKESLPFRTKQEVVIEPDSEDAPPEDLDPGRSGGKNIWEGLGWSGKKWDEME